MKNPNAILDRALRARAASHVANGLTRFSAVSPAPTPPATRTNDLTAFEAKARDVASKFHAMASAPTPAPVDDSKAIAALNRTGRSFPGIIFIV